MRQGLCRIVLAGGVAAAVWPATALAQTLGQGQGGADISWWRVIGALVLCLGLAVGAAFALRTRLRGGIGSLLTTNSRLTLIETVRVNQTLDICAVRFDGREFVIAATPHTVTVLEARDAPPPPATTDAQT